MGEGEDTRKAVALRGGSAARIVKFTLVAFALSAAALIVAAALNPDPAALPVDYGGFD